MYVLRLSLIVFCSDAVVEGLFGSGVLKILEASSIACAVVIELCRAIKICH